MNLSLVKLLFLMGLVSGNASALNLNLKAKVNLGSAGIYTALVNLVDHPKGTLDSNIVERTRIDDHDQVSSGCSSTVTFKGAALTIRLLDSNGLTVDTLSMPVAFESIYDYVGDSNFNCLIPFPKHIWQSAHHRDEYLEFKLSPKNKLALNIKDLIGSVQVSEENAFSFALKPSGHERLTWFLNNNIFGSSELVDPTAPEDQTKPGTDPDAN